jgi:hypothetical protein
MKYQQIIGWFLLTTAFLVLLGMLLKIDIYWFVIDIAVIVICSGSSYFLLRKKKEAE